jgi:hypothetical protein
VDCGDSQWLLTVVVWCSVKANRGGFYRVFLERRLIRFRMGRNVLRLFGFKGGELVFSMEVARVDA